MFKPCFWCRVTFYPVGLFEGKATLFYSWNSVSLYLNPVNSVKQVTNLTNLVPKVSHLTAPGGSKIRDPGKEVEI